MEIMGSSDNVLRGGLTPKHVDVPELLRVLDVAAGPVPVLRPVALSEHERRYDAPTPELVLSRLDLPAGDRWAAPVAGPEVLLCVEGRVAVGSEGAPATLELGPGDSAFVEGTASTRVVQAQAQASVFRATVPAPLPRAD